MHWLALGTGLLFTQPAAPAPRDPAAPIEITGPDPDLPPRTDPQPPVRSHRIGRLPGYIGLGAGVGRTGSTIGGADRLATTTAYGAPTDDLYIGVLGRFDATVLGQDHGGARLHGRSTFEVMWRVRRAAKIRLATLLFTYEGTRITAAPGRPQFDPLGERRTSHQLLLALGATI
jgi:hypothetical protein